MKKVSLLLAIAMVITLFAPAFAVPLFPDVPEQHWARDAVADLAAKGVLEGYPDGTFKGDRAATRWEMAVALQRMLAKIEAQQATFATRADLEALRALVNNLRDELDALGVRVRNLEDNVAAIDQRVTELERITFEGDLAARLVTIGVSNRGTTVGNWPLDVGSINAVNFARGHKLGTIDLINGRPYLDGVSFTARARLGVNVKISQDFAASARFAAFTSMGNDYISAYWGVNAPYLSNPFAANQINTFMSSGLNNTPWTRMNFDKFTLRHLPSGTTLTLGAIEHTDMDTYVLSRVPNPNISGKSLAAFRERVVADARKTEVSSFSYAEDEETYLPFFGAQVAGRGRLLSDMTWEVLYSKLPYGAIPTQVGVAPLPNTAMFPQVAAGNLAWDIQGNGKFKINFMQAFESNPVGTNNLVVPNHGNYWFWTDPVSYLAVPPQQAPMRQTSLVPGFAANDAFISQQSNSTLGASINYVFGCNVRVLGAYSHSWYKPNVQSDYVARGNHYRLGVGWTNNANTLDLDLEWLSTDPYYNAMQLYFPPIGALPVGGLPIGSPTGFSVVPTFYGGFPGAYIPFGYQLHDSGLFPNNRQGIKFGAEYRFAEGNGRANLRTALLRQVNAAAPHIDITGVYNGMRPGFIDPVFYMLATDPTRTTVPEVPRGRANQYGGGIEYTFQPSRFNASIQFDHFDFRRDTSFAAGTFVAANNYVNLKYNVGALGLKYPMGTRFTLNGGFDFATLRGYHPEIALPLGLNQAITLNHALDVRQYVPHLGFDYDLSTNTTWSVTGRYVMVRDRLNDGVSPQSFNALQFMTTVKVKF